MRRHLISPLIILASLFSLTGCQIIQIFDHPIPVTSDYSRSLSASETSDYSQYLSTSETSDYSQSLSISENSHRTSK